MGEKRMYVLVPYNLSDIQKGIQAAHAIVEYSTLAQTGKLQKPFDNLSYYKDYIQWSTVDKTLIILNGGTTGENSSMYKYHDDLKKLHVLTRCFYEPDLNDAMTAIAFVLDMEKDSHIIQYLKSMNLA